MQIRIVQFERRPHRAHDRLLFVVRRHDEGHRWRDRGRPELIQALVRQSPVVEPYGDQRYRHQNRIDPVPSYEIRSQQQVEERQAF